MTSLRHRATCYLLVALLTWAPPAAAQAPIGRIVGAANAFLSTLDQEQRGRVLFAFDDLQQRVRWSNLPTPIVRRAGLKIGELNPKQRDAALVLLASTPMAPGTQPLRHMRLVNPSPGGPNLTAL